LLSPTTATLVVPTGQAAAPVTFSYTGPPVAIPDSHAAGASVSFTVGGIGALSKVTFSIDGGTCTNAVGATTVGIDHTWVGDLIGTLTSPSGTAVTLFSRPGGQLNSGNNLCQVVLDDSAASPIQGIAIAGAPWTGSWRPAQPLSTLLGENGDGTWTFKVTDNALTDIGSLRAVSLHLGGFVS
jgi:subtilisin-like proprotein convertase family protein